MALTSDDILKELKAGQYRRVYLLMGDEPYPIDVVSDYIEANALTPDEKAFNQTVVYGADTNGKQIWFECDQFPTFASRRVVIVKEAQRMTGIADLTGYVSKALESTVLVLCYKGKAIDKRLRLYKEIDKAGGAILETKSLYDNQMPMWIVSHARKAGYSIEERAAELLAEFVGTSQSDAAAAIEKIRSAVGPSLKTITVDMVADNVGVSKEYNAFELQDALFRKDRQKAMRIVYGMSRTSGFSVIPVFATLYRAFDHLFTYTFTKIKSKSVDAAVKAALSVGQKSEFMVRKNFEPASNLFTATDCMRITNVIAQYDARSRGFNYPTTTDRELLIDVVSQILG